jgi:hypothetical protein
MGSGFLICLWKGRDGITPAIRGAIRNKFEIKELNKIIKDTSSVSGWIHDQILMIAGRKEEGGRNAGE